MTATAMIAASGTASKAATRTRGQVTLPATFRTVRRAAGPALVGAIAFAGASIISAVLLLLGIWLTPLVFASAAIVVVLSGPRRAASVVRRAARKVAGEVTWPRVRVAALLAVPFAAIVAVAASEAAAEDITKVRQILDDPAAVHISPNDH